MATLVDFGLFRTFSPIFVFLIVFIFTYVVLLMVPAFKEKKSLVMILAFLMAMIFSVYPDMTAFISQMTPGLVFFLVFIMFVLITLSAVGLDSKDILNLFGARDNRGATWFFIIIILIIVGSAASSIFGNRLVSLTDDNDNKSNNATAKDEFEQNLTRTIFNPKILGLVFMFLIVVFAMIFLGPRGPAPS
jgi:hypothetical protein